MKQTFELMRWDIINYLIIKYKLQNYLEVGHQNGYNFSRIKAPMKISIDPEISSYSKATYQMTSDEFFEKNEITFDIIFLDGDHRSPQIWKDGVNALNCLNEGGFVILHDCNPKTEEMQAVPRTEKVWTGDCWKDLLKFRQSPDLEVRVVNTDYGVGIIRKGKQITLEKITEDYHEFEKDKQRLLNLISIKDFYKYY